MADKVFNLFDECSARCVHLLHGKIAPVLPKGYSNVHIWEHSKFTDDAN